MKRCNLLLIAVIVFSIAFIQAIPGLQFDQAQAAQPSQTNEKIFKTVTPVQAKDLMEHKQDILVVDIRNPQELSEGVIEGSTLIPLWDIVKRKKRIPHDRPIMLICAVGGRSLTLGKLLSANGYPEIYNLKGGISAWKKAGLPVTY